MLGNLFSRKRTKLGEVSARVPEGRRVYAIGDIHGRADLLRRLHLAIAEDAAAKPSAENVVIYLGDYIDRGQDSRGVLDLLINGAPQGFECVYLSGNHEDFMVRFFEDLKVGSAWINNGGGATLMSYGVGVGKIFDENALKEVQNKLMAAVPPSHWSFLHDLKTHHIEGDYFFAHAGLRPGVPIDEQRSADLMWIREEFLTSEIDHGYVVVHGHSINPKAEVLPNRIGIDTGAYATDRLTCLVLEGEERDFLRT